MIKWIMGIYVMPKGTGMEYLFIMTEIDIKVSMRMVKGQDKVFFSLYS